MRRITSGDKFAGSPKWSPDGQRIVFYEMEIQDTFYALVAALGKPVDSQIVSVEIEFIRIDGDIAIVMGAETVQRVGDAPTIQRRFTDIWKRDGTTWCAIARHANVVSAR